MSGYIRRLWRVSGWSRSWIRLAPFRRVFCPRLPPPAGLCGGCLLSRSAAGRGDFYDFIELPPEPDPVSVDLPAVRAGAASPRAATVVEVACANTTSPSPVAVADISRLGIVIADVTDKGVPAALFMALCRTLLRATASDGHVPAVVLERANRLILADSRAGLFVTCFYAQLDPTTGTLTYASGGHNYPLLYRVATGIVEPLRAQGIVLGIVPQPHFVQQSVTFAPGDMVVLHRWCNRGDECPARAIR